MRIEDFRVKMAVLEDGPQYKIVALSVFENFLCDAVGVDPDRAGLNKLVGEVCEDFISTIHQAAKKIIDTEFIIVKPLLRPRHKWYQESYEDICKFLLVKTVGLKSRNISVIECLFENIQKFLFDQIHLQSNVGKRFVDNIIRGISVMQKRAEQERDGISDVEIEEEEDEAGFLTEKWTTFGVLEVVSCVLLQ